MLVSRMDMFNIKNILLIILQRVCCFWGILFRKYLAGHNPPSFFKSEKTWHLNKPELLGSSSKVMNFTKEDDCAHGLYFRKQKYEPYP